MEQKFGMQEFSGLLNDLSNEQLLAIINGICERTFIMINNGGYDKNAIFKIEETVEDKKIRFAIIVTINSESHTWIELNTPLEHNGKIVFTVEKAKRHAYTHTIVNIIDSSLMRGLQWKAETNNWDIL